MEKNTTVALDASPSTSELDYIRTLQVVFLSLFFITGIPGNSVICLLVYRSPRLRTVTMVTNLIVGNLAVSDLAVCLLKIPVSLLSIIKNQWILDNNFCNAVGFVNSLLLFEVLYSLALVSVSRYCCVVAPSKFSVIFTRRRTYGIIAATWVMSTISAAPPLFGWGLFQFEYGKAICVIGVQQSISYTIVLSLLQFALPFLLITVPYFKIFRFLRMHNRRLSANSITSSFRRQSRTSLFHDFKMTKLLLIVVCFFVACWAPYTIVNLLAGFGLINNIPLVLDCICNLLTFLSSSFNPFIYGSFNNQFRKGFRDIFCSSCRTYERENDRVGYTTRRLTSNKSSLSLKRSLLGSQRENRRNHSNKHTKTRFAKTKESHQYETTLWIEIVGHF